MKSKRRIYLDFASATPIDKDVIKTMAKTMKCFANPASLYTEGREAKKILDNSRKTLADLIRAHADEVVFTSGGTESNNLALFGVLDYFAKFLQTFDIPKNDVPKKLHIIVSSIEHSSILETAKKLEARGVEVSYIRPDKDGIINPKDVRDALRDNTVLVSIMYANNEIGTIEPITEIVKVIRHYRNEKKNIFHVDAPFFHTDAAQAANYLLLDILKLNVDMITLDSGKIYGPKGVGALIIKRNVPVVEQMIGGGQENNRRSSTENIVSIVGFVKAFEICQKTKEKESKRLLILRDYFIKQLLQIPNTTINGSILNRLPNNISVCIENIDAEFAVYQLDECGISCSSASTCMNLKEDSFSYVVREISEVKDCSTSSLRFSLGRTTIKKDIDFCLKSLKEVILKQNRV